MINVKVIPMMQSDEDDAAMSVRLTTILQAIEAAPGAAVIEVSCDSGRMIVVYRVA